MEILKITMRDFRVKSMINICKRFFRNENRIIEKIRIPTNEIYSAKYPYGKNIENKSKILSSIQKILMTKKLPCWKFWNFERAVR